MLHNKNDDLLISLIQQGDCKALESLFEKYYTSLCRFATYFTNRSDLAEEIVADVFFKIWDKRESLVIDRNLRSYLFTATRHISINYLKQEKTPMTDLSDDLIESNPGPMESLMYEEFETSMHRLIDVLPQKRKVIFQLNRFEGFTYKEIAEILDLSSKTVENQMGKAIKQLKLLQKPFFA